jgi:hypothetical protein
LRLLVQCCIGKIACDAALADVPTAANILAIASVSGDVVATMVMYPLLFLLTMPDVFLLLAFPGSQLLSRSLLLLATLLLLLILLLLTSQESMLWQDSLLLPPSLLLLTSLLLLVFPPFLASLMLLASRWRPCYC